jgi:CheY-like chemotaxis protein
MPNDSTAGTHPRPVGNRVLLVEDDEGTRRQLRQILETRGYIVQEAADGQQALEVLRRTPAPAVILLNLTMPVLDGWAFRKQQRRDPALAAIPVIILSTHGDQVWHAEEFGEVGFLRKPVNPAELEATLHRFIGPRRPEVLVVEDEPAVLKMLDVALRHYGFCVWCAANASEAVHLLEQQKGTVDVALLDVQMPGVDGPKTLAALRTIKPDLPAVYMSGSTGSYSVDDLLRTGAVRVLQKPFASMGDLAQVLSQAADQIRAGKDQS